MKLLIFAFILIYQLAAQTENLRIVIDPGHGGSDKGAVRDSFTESKIVLEISKKLKERLEKLNFNDVHLTRDNDMTLSLKDRVQTADKLGADIFVSLHANTSVSPLLSGMEFYFNAPTKSARSDASTRPERTNNEVLARIQQDFKNYEKTEKSLLLSKSVQASTAASVSKSVIRRAPFYVVENTTMPSILIELGFISNRREAKKLSSDDYQNEIVERIAQALIEYKNKSDKAHTL